MKNFIFNNKGFNMIELAITLVIAGILALGFLGRWGDRGDFTHSYRIEYTALVKTIIAKEKEYAAKNNGKYFDIPKTTDGYCMLGSSNIEIDASRNKYFGNFEVKSNTVSMPDALGNMRSLPVLIITVYGIGSISDKKKVYEYNRFNNQLREITEP